MFLAKNTKFLAVFLNREEKLMQDGGDEMASILEMKGRVAVLQQELKGKVFNNGDARAKTRELEILNDRLGRKITKQNGFGANGNGQGAAIKSYWKDLHPL